MAERREDAALVRRIERERRLEALYRHRAEKERALGRLIPHSVDAWTHAARSGRDEAERRISAEMAGLEAGRFDSAGDERAYRQRLLEALWDLRSTSVLEEEIRARIDRLRAIKERCGILDKSAERAEELRRRTEELGTLLEKLRGSVWGRDYDLQQAALRCVGGLEEALAGFRDSYDGASCVVQSLREKVDACVRASYGPGLWETICDTMLSRSLLGMLIRWLRRERRIDPFMEARLELIKTRSQIYRAMARISWERADLLCGLMKMMDEIQRPDRAAE